MDTEEGIDFNDYNFADMKLDLINLNGEVIAQGLTQVYGDYYKISNERTVSFANRYNDFLTEIKDVEYNFVGDKFYEKYLK